MLVGLLGALHDSLLTALEELVAERQLLVRIVAPAQGLLERANSKAVFQRKSHQLQERLLEELSAACEEAGLAAPSISALADRLGPAAEPLRARYAQVSALACKYAQEEQINGQILERTLLCVKAYVTALSPKPTYDRRGYVSHARLSTVSTRI